MARKNDALDFVLDELRSRGIKFETETSGSNHIEIRWQVAKEKEVRSYFVPSTPSDHRGRLNARAQIRKLLLKDGADLNLATLDRARKQAPLLTRALELPAHVETVPDQLRAIRAELVDLNDLMLDLFSKLDALREHVLTRAAAEPEERRLLTVAPPAKPIARRPSRRIKVLDLLSHNWISFDALARDTGLTAKQIYGKMYYLAHRSKRSPIEMDASGARLKPTKPHLVNSQKGASK